MKKLYSSVNPPASFKKCILLCTALIAMQPVFSQYAVTVCKVQNATIVVNSANPAQWYQQEFGNTPFFAGNSRTGPNMEGSITYWVEANGRKVPATFTGIEQLTNVAGYDSVATLVLSTKPSVTAMHVDSTAGDDANDGSTWATAVKTLSIALKHAAEDNSTDSILIAKGTYYPAGTADNTDANIDSAFYIYRNGIRLYGGYDAATGLRDIAANKVYLDGNNSSHHILAIVGIADGDSVIVDGITIRNAGAGDGTLHFYNGVGFNPNEGGGVTVKSCNSLGNKLLFRNCAFVNNVSNNNGAAFYNGQSSPSFVNCLFANNTATNNGGAMFNYDNSNPVVTNCTIVYNVSANGAAMVNVSNCTPVLNNSIVWLNGTTAGANNSGITSDGSPVATGSYSIIQGGIAGNSTAGPLFVNAAGGNYTLSAESPAINTGSNGLYAGNINNDIDLGGNTRLLDATIDMGAYESGYPSGLSYAGAPFTFIKGVDIGVRQPTVTGAVNSYTVNPALPDGLSFNTATGVISGTPAAVSNATGYTVMAINSAGSTTAIIDITVNDAAPYALTYTGAAFNFDKGNAVAFRAPTASGGAIAGYSISPALRNGLTFNTVTGVIGGTPTDTMAASAYTVTAVNITGSTTATLQISIGERAPGNFAYTPAVAFTTGIAVAPLAPVAVAGGTTDSITTVNMTPAQEAIVADNNNIYISNVESNIGPMVAKVSKLDFSLTTINLTHHLSLMAVDTAGNIFFRGSFPTELYKMTADPFQIIDVLSVSPLTFNFLAVDYAGNGYAITHSTPAVSGNIFKIPPAGVITSFPLPAGALDMYLAVNPATGDMYVFGGDGSLLKISADGVTVTTIASREVTGGPALISADAFGNVYFTGGSVRRFAEDGTVNSYPIDLRPEYMSVDAAGNIYYTCRNLPSPFAIFKRLYIGGGQPASYAISPTLPAGLVFNTATGVISGTPTSESPQTRYVITAHNSGGNTKAALLLNVCTPTASTTAVTVCASALPYHWNGVNYSAPGSYTFTTTNAGGCDSVATLILTVNQPTTSTTLKTICSTELPYTWNGIVFTEAGTQVAHLNNAAGCDSSATLALTVAEPTTSTTNITICATALPYTWNGRLYKAAGKHTVHLTNAAGCDSAATLVLKVNTLSGTYKAGQTTLCYNETTSSTVDADGGLKPYQFSIDTGATYQPLGHFELVEAGSYSVTIKDAMGCTAATNAVVIQKPTAPISISLIKTGVTCKNASDGIITVNAGGGYGNYKYRINSGAYQAANIFSSLPAGRDTVYVKDAASCAARIITTLVQPGKPCASLSAVKPGISSAKAESILKVKAYPNPTLSSFTLIIDGGDDKAPVELRVMDINGKTVYHTRGSVNRTYIFGQSFAAGMYVAEVLNGKNINHIKLVKAN